LAIARIGAEEGKEMNKLAILNLLTAIFVVVIKFDHTVQSGILLVVLLINLLYLVCKKRHKSAEKDQ
jgi:uncharacterized membrane protein